MSLAGPLSALAIVPSPTGAPGLLVAGVGGVWRFDPGTQSWSPGSLAAPVGSLAVAPDGTLYAGMGELDNGDGGRAGTGIMRSGDGGVLWTAEGASVFSGLAIARLAVDPSDPAHLLAVAATVASSPASAQPGLYSSMDGGASWTLLLPGTFWDLAWHGNEVLAAGAIAIELSAADAAPGSFAPLAGLPAGWVRAAVAPADSGGFLLLLADANGGASLWSTAASSALSAAGNLPMLDGRHALALAENAAGQILAGGAGLWLLPEANSAWQPVSIAASAQRVIQSGSGGDFWVAGEHGLWRVPLGGNVAATLNTGLSNMAPLALRVGSAGVLAGLDGGGLATGPAAVTADWTVVPGPVLTALAPDAAQPGGLYGIAGGVLVHSGDSGVTWQPQALPAGLEGVPTALLACPQGLWIGTSAGQLMSPAGALMGFAQPVSAIAASAGGVWVAAGAAIYSSQDAGADWTTLAQAPAVITALALDPEQPSVAAAAGAAGVFWSLNGGASWSTPMPLAGGVPVTALQFDSHQTLWAATLGRGLWSASFQDSTAAIAILDPPAGVAAGAEITLRARLLQSGVPVAGAALQFAASANGRSVWSGAAATDASGTATVQFSVHQAGALTVQVVAPGEPSALPAQVSFPVTAAPPAHMVLISGGGQFQPVATVLTSPIVIAVYDAFGNPVAGVTVDLDGGDFSASSPITSPDGRIQVTLRLPASPGPVACTARVAGLPPLSWQDTAFSPDDFQLLLAPPGAPSPPGQPQRLVLQIAPRNGFNEPVALSCLQPVMNCTIAPPTLLPGASATVTVTSLLNQSSLTVQIAGTESAAAAAQGAVTHTAAVALPLEAFTMTAALAAVTVQAGATTVPIPLNLTAINGLGGSVQFQIIQSDGSPLPAGLVPAFQPPAAALAGISTAVQLRFTIAAAAPSSQGGFPPIGPDAGLALLLLVVGVLTLTVARSAATWRHPERQPLSAAPSAYPPRFLRLFGIACLCLGAVACGGGGAVAPATVMPSAPPPSVYNLQVSASVQGLSASVPLRLTVANP